QDRATRPAAGPRSAGDRVGAGGARARPSHRGAARARRRRGAGRDPRPRGRVRANTGLARARWRAPAPRLRGRRTRVAHGETAGAPRDERRGLAARSAQMTPARACAFAVLRRVFEQGAYADKAFAAEAAAA